MAALGKALIVLGVAIVAVGALLMFSDRLPFRVGRLPGDIIWEGKNGTLYFPIVTCLLISAIVTLIGWLIGRRG